MRRHSTVIIACSSIFFARAIADSIQGHVTVPILIALNDKELENSIGIYDSSLILIEENFNMNITSYVIGTLQEKYPHSRFVVFSFRDLEPHEVSSFLNTASSIINCRLGTEECLKGFNKILSGSDYIPENISTIIENLNIEPMKRIALTKREKMILSLLADGKKTNEIGKILGISKETVRIHKKNVYAKCGVHNQFDLIKFADTLKRYGDNKVIAESLIG